VVPLVQLFIVLKLDLLLLFHCAPSQLCGLFPGLHRSHLFSSLPRVTSQLRVLVIQSLLKISRLPSRASHRLVGVLRPLDARIPIFPTIFNQAIFYRPAAAAGVSAILPPL
jgi:hypothetical protein